MAAGAVIWHNAMAFNATHLSMNAQNAYRRWCITYKRGKSNGRHGGYGRVWYDEIQPTVVGRAEPHNLKLVHPTQHRVLSVLENARCQVG